MQFYFLFDTSIRVFGNLSLNFIYYEDVGKFKLFLNHAFRPYIILNWKR